ncbi:uracil-DNA glycosylase family protein [Marinobacterium sediminicola]|uniref:Uracil-DNA glycosylase n=1 Tax=Marinobacterium sediminicola TaxID=518898 RepID=A0ABY1RWF2_9GAMM|nr:uracil-DNA glycosylase family protein [Marinobacterium sediminicola]ULG70420.1 uracil-DNA glycosylase family protein [Marinobacterium sediminicola]SMR69405.1 Uracil-DNA glycosylase [Marinobacterium sediminicola]
MSVLQQLLAEVRACRLCAKELPLGPRPVVQAAVSARLLIVGQAPGLKVHQTGIPFNDPSGDRLRDWLGMSRDEFYDPTNVAILPMGFCYPGRGQSGDNPPRPECATAWRQQLLSQLPDIELTLLIGRYAQDWHLGKGITLTERVRHWRAYLPGCIPLPHPSPRNNLWLRRNPWFEEELLPELKRRIAGIRAESA